MSVLTVAFSFIGIALGPALAFFEFEPLIHIARRFIYMFPEMSKSTTTCVYLFTHIVRVIFISIVSIESLRFGWLLIVFSLVTMRALSKMMRWTERQYLLTNIHKLDDKVTLYKHSFLVCDIMLYCVRTLGLCMLIIGVLGIVTFNFFVIAFFHVIPPALGLICIYTSVMFACDTMLINFYASNMNETSKHIIARLRAVSGKSKSNTAMGNRVVKSLKASAMEYGLGNYVLLTANKDSNMTLLNIVLQRTMEAIVIGSLV